MFRKKAIRLLTCLILLTGVFSLSLKGKRDSLQLAVKAIATIYEQDMRSFDSLLAVYPTYFPDSSYARRIDMYHRLAYSWKRVEGIFAYFHPKLTYESILKTAQFEKRDFGPPFPDNWILLGPFGIDTDSAALTKTKGDSVFEKRFIERGVTNFRKLFATSGFENEVAQMTEGQVMDALRLQMARISTMGIANGDFVIEEAGMAALEGSYESWCRMVRILCGQLEGKDALLRKSIEDRMAVGASLLDKKPSFNTFNRMQFLTEVLLPLSEGLSGLQKALDIRLPAGSAAFRPTAKHLYEANALDPDYFAPGVEAYLTDAKVELGKFLFFDPILSDNNERACASCHKPELAFTDGNIKSVNFERGDLPRNSPTVINSVFQKAQFWDLRVNSLEDQLDSVINSPDELHSSFENVIDRINESPEYKKLFWKAFPETKRAGIRRKHVKFAIACYERTLTGMNSRFDEYVRGDHSKMDAQEIHGFNIFMGKARCGTCHYAPLFNGALPPYFDFTDHRSIGVPIKDTMEKYEVDPDLGVAKNSANPFQNFSFKVPTVRNAALTAPYMHNGIYKTLEQVVNFYDHAGGDKFIKDMRPGLKGLPFFMILPVELKLTDDEKKSLVAFMKTLNDTHCSTQVPSRLPKLEGKYAKLNERKIGGVY